MSSITQNFIVLDMIQIKQLDSGFIFTGKIKFSELNQVYKLTERTPKTHDSKFGDGTVDVDEVNKEFFQRQLSRQKVKAIKEYLMDALNRGEGSVALFPSSVILYNRPYEYDDLNTDQEIDSPEKLTEEIIQKSYNKDIECCFYRPCEKFCKLYIPRHPNITLIVDGQHRFAGTKELFDSLPESDERKEKVGDFEFIVTFLYGFDLHEVGKIFADVNFTQKPVNRSLYYDIFGSAPRASTDGDKENEIRLAHDLAVHLNNNSLSPIRDMIKLLGKGHGLFSQAFFVDHIRNHVFKSGVWEGLIEDYLSDGDEYKVIATFMKAYFSALKKAYPSNWPQKITKSVGGEQKEVYSSYHYKNVMCKTTGMGAYIRLIKDIYPLVKESPPNFEGEILEIFKRISDDEAKQLFSREGKYGAMTGEGAQGNLYKELLSRYKLTQQKSLLL